MSVSALVNGLIGLLFPPKNTLVVRKSATRMPSTATASVLALSWNKPVSQS